MVMRWFSKKLYNAWCAMKRNARKADERLGWQISRALRLITFIAF